VLSTLHTNDAVGAVSRLRDYGLPAFVINSAVLGVLAQRLVRRVCQHCIMRDTIDDLARRRFNLDEEGGEFVRGKGCTRCGQTGYRGRVGIYEFLHFGPEVKSLVEQGASTDQIRARAVADGMRLMWQDGLDKARLGQTTLSEVFKVASVIEIGPPSSPSTDERLVA
jgi:type IV pilus assembly protein PilB